MKSVRFPDDLAARVQAHADAVDRSFSYLVVKATEQAAREWDEVVAAVNAGAEVRVEAGSIQPPAEPVTTVLGSKVRKGSLPRRADTLPGDTLPAPSAFRCPVARCEFEAKSPAAKCGMHGRTVVPV